MEGWGIHEIRMDRDGSRERARVVLRSRSRSGDGGGRGDYGVDSIQITDDDAAFVLGKGGKTKEKLARLSECEIELFEDLVLELRGTAEQRRRGRAYCTYVMQQRTGPVSVRERDGDDLTSLMVPQEAVGFVTGRQGSCRLCVRRGAVSSADPASCYGSLPIEFFLLSILLLNSINSAVKSVALIGMFVATFHLCNTHRAIG